MKNYFERLRLVWAARQPRERAFLVGLALFAAFAVLAQALWTAHHERARLKKQIPHLAQQVETLQRKAADLQQLKSLPATPAPAEGNALLAMAVSAAESAGLREAAPQLKLEGPRRLRLRATLPFDRWVVWVAALQRDGQVRLVSCQAKAGAAPGSADIDALFALPDPL